MVLLCDLDGARCRAGSSTQALTLKDGFVIRPERGLGLGLAFLGCFEGVVEDGDDRIFDFRHRQYSVALKISWPGLSQRRCRLWMEAGMRRAEGEPIEASLDAAF